MDDGDVGKLSGVGCLLREVIQDDVGQHGFVFLPGPTGIGKTHGVAGFMCGRLVRDGPKCRRMIFVSSIKRNLPVELLKSMLQASGHPELLDYVVYLDSNLDSFVNNLASAIELMPTKPFTYLKRVRVGSKEKYKAEPAEFDILSLPEFCDARKKAHDYISLRDGDYLLRSYGQKIINAARDDLEAAERALRVALFNVFRSMCIVDGGEPKLLTNAAKRNLVTNNAWWKWLGILYPAALTFNKRIIFMSVDKLMVQNSPVIEPSESILDSELLDGSVVFIDEFELSKDTINRRIIQDSVKQMGDSVGLFRALFGPLIEGHAALRLKRDSAGGLKLSSKLFMSPSDKPGSGRALRVRLDKILDAAEEVYRSLHLDNQFMLSEELRYRDRPFLFNDFQSHVVSSRRSTWAAIQFLPSENRISFGSGVPPQALGDVDGSNPEGYYPVPLLLGRLDGLIRWMADWMVDAAENYVNVKAEQARDGRQPAISFDQAAGTVLSELNMMDGVQGEINPNRARLLAMIYEARRSRNVRDDDSEEGSSKSPVDLCLHRNGFGFHEFAESGQHDTITVMRRCGFPFTAEHLLINICSNNFVVGISASAELLSVLGNYDLDYIKDSLGDLFIELSDSQRGRILADFSQSVKGYGGVEIQPISICDVGADGAYSVSCWSLVFNDPFQARSVFNQVSIAYDQVDGSQCFGQRRVFKTCLAFKRFWQAQDARAMLYVCNKLPRAGDPTFDLDLLYKLFGDIFRELGVDRKPEDAVCVLGGANAVFERAKAKATELLSQGEKLFVMTAYQSAGAGQNLQYSIPHGAEPVKINDRPASTDMDYDCLYLETPTHTSPQLTPDERYSEEDVLDHILKCEYLYESAEISRSQLFNSVKQALLALGGAGCDYGYKSTDSARLYGLKQVYQAVGRLCRTNMKMPVIRLMFDSNLLTGVPLDALESCGIALTPEFEAIVNAFRGSDSVFRVADGRYERRAAMANDRSRACINALLGSEWHEDDRRAWYELGDQVLSHPTIPDDIQAAPYMKRNYYLELPEASTSYRYTSVGDFRNVEVSFEKASPKGTFAVSEQSTRLESLMRIPGMEEHFKQLGYATSWRSARFIMTPVVSESIYKGRLGEVCGRFIFENSDIDLIDIDDASTFEKFDFAVGDDGARPFAYVDFKHWRNTSDKSGLDKEKLLDWIFLKMEQVDARRAVIANILPPDSGSYRPSVYARRDQKLLIAPALVTPQFEIDTETLVSIRRFINGTFDQ